MGIIINKGKDKKSIPAFTGMSVQEVSHCKDLTLGSVKNGGSAIMEVLHSKLHCYLPAFKHCR